MQTARRENRLTIPEHFERVSLVNRPPEGRDFSPAVKPRKNKGL